MDTVEPIAMGRGRILAARVRQAAVEGGIGPDSPLAPFVEAIAQATEEITEASASVPGEVHHRVAPLLDEVRTLTAEAQRAADKPLMTDHQVKWTIVPALLAAWNVWQALLLVGAVALGFGLHWWMSPALICGPTFQNRPICFRFDGPPLTAASPAQQQGMH